MNSDRRGGREGPNDPWDKDTRTMTLPLVTYLPQCQESLPGEKRGGVNMDSRWCIHVITVEMEADRPVLSTFQKQRDHQG